MAQYQTRIGKAGNYNADESVYYIFDYQYIRYE